MEEPQYHDMNELRRMFLRFFKSKDHLAMKSFSLMPHNDNSLFSANSGMAPLRPYFTGQEIPPRSGVTTYWKCIYTDDIGNTGKTARHDTFFEMLGNLSFGDYFKTEAIHWIWGFLADVVELDPDRLYPSVYLDDDEALGIRNKEIGIPVERVFKFGKKDNFWEHDSGPCGPCSEVYCDRGEAFGCGKPGCTAGCDYDCYIEVQDSVFTQFNSDGHGHYIELEHKNIDTGMELERLVVAVQGVDPLFTVDTNKAFLDRVCQLMYTEYQKDHETDVSLRIVADHVKSCTSMVSDGTIPSNEGRGYVLRRPLRRAAHHERELGIGGRSLASLSETIIELSKGGYPELEERQAMMSRVLSEEEEGSNKTIDQGLSILGEMQGEMQRTGNRCLFGANTFKPYDTYGLPLGLAKEILEERGCTVDEDGFTTAVKEQKEKARKTRETTNCMGTDVTVYQSIDPSVTTEFIGYDRLTANSRMTILTTEEELVQALTDGQKGTIIVEQTPFYGTIGGQQGSTGVISDENDAFKIEDVIHLQGGRVGHVGVMTKGMFQVGENVTLSVCAHDRVLTCKSHSAAHLLQKALRKVLGDHVEQAGSYVDAGRLHFDFIHLLAMAPDEIEKMEELVSQEIQAPPPVVTQAMTLEEVKETGTMTLFGEKYGDKVRMIRIGDFSVELYGGAHVSNTGTITYFKIISEAGITAGIRRIEALVSGGLMKHYRGMEEGLQETTRAAKATPFTLTPKIQSLLEEIKTPHSENEELEGKPVDDSLGDVMSQVKEVSGLKILIARVVGVDMNGTRDLDDRLKDKLGEGVIVLACERNGKVNLMATAADSAQKKDAYAGNLIKAVIGLMGGDDGGRPNMARVGDKDPAGIDDTLKKAVETAKGQTK